MFRSVHRVAALVVAATFAGAVQGASWDESVQGDLSDNGLAPSTLILDPGHNVVAGHFGMGRQAGVADLDYLHIVVPAHLRLQGLRLLELVQGGDASFLAIQAGPQLTLPPNAVDPSPLMGYAHIRPVLAAFGTNLLTAMNVPSTLPAGDYTFWINETDTSEAWRYALDFEAVAVPELATVWLWLGAGVLLARRRRVR
ncbi:MAG: hypothetical protein EKK53_08090 [Burkholderiales bacterium]|nr:MAG: hypothetical protein EKK53_08090 [Burkholderiales bacterium]